MLQQSRLAYRAVLVGGSASLNILASELRGALLPSRRGECNQKTTRSGLLGYEAAASPAGQLRPLHNAPSFDANYSIAVPSYDRAATLQKRTLAALHQVGVDCSNRVHVFVANDQEAVRYKQVLSPASYASIIVGTLGIGRQRDLILDHFGAGANVVMLDDDIERFIHKYDSPLNLHEAIVKGFELSCQHGCFMWGINNSSNKFFLRPTYTVGWCFFQGPFMAFRVRDGVRLHPEFHDVKEDVQYSLMHCERDGKVLRLNGFGLKARPYKTEPGGLQSVMSMEYRAERGRVNHDYLATRYSRFVHDWTYDRPHPKMRRSSGHTVVGIQF